MFNLLTEKCFAILNWVKCVLPNLVGWHVERLAFVQIDLQSKETRQDTYIFTSFSSILGLMMGDGGRSGGKLKIYTENLSCCDHLLLWKSILQRR